MLFFSDASDFFLDDISSSSDEDDIDLIYEEQNTEIERFSSPICWEKNYTEFFIHSLPQLKIFDGIKISKSFRERSSKIYFLSFQDVERDFSGRKILSPLQSLIGREYGSLHKSCHSNSLTITSNSFRKDICSTLISKYQQPKMTILSSDFHTPRQFEYHPSLPSTLLYGTINGELVIINTKTRKIINQAVSK